MIQSANSVTTSFHVTSAPSPTPTTISAIHCTYAIGMFTWPEGTGRNRFVGWCTSEGASITSLIT